jgi:hypothetical protein
MREVETPPRGWAASPVQQHVRPSDDVLIVGAHSDGTIAEALRGLGCSVSATDDMTRLDAAARPDVIVLDEALAWVPDEIAALRAVVDVLQETTRLVVVVPNVTWFPYRMQLLLGDAPFGNGPVAHRPLRFFARGTVLRALAAAGLTVEDLIAVQGPATEPDATLDPVLAERLRAGEDADVVGFVALANRTPVVAQPPDRAPVLDPPGPELVSLEAMGAQQAERDAAFERLLDEVRQQDVAHAEAAREWIAERATLLAANGALTAKTVELYAELERERAELVRERTKLSRRLARRAARYVRRA